MPPSCGQPRRPGPAAQQDTERPTRGFTGLTAPPGACRQVRTLTGAERRQAPGALTSDPALQGPAERAGPPVRLRAPLSTAHREGGGNPTRPRRGGGSPSVYGASYHAVHQAPRQRGFTDVLDDLLQVFQPSPACRAAPSAKGIPRRRLVPARTRSQRPRRTRKLEPVACRSRKAVSTSSTATTLPKKHP